MKEKSNYRWERLRNIKEKSNYKLEGLKKIKETNNYRLDVLKNVDGRSVQTIISENDLVNPNVNNVVIDYRQSKTFSEFHFEISNIAKCFEIETPSQLDNTCIQGAAGRVPKRHPGALPGWSCSQTARALSLVATQRAWTTKLGRYRELAQNTVGTLTE